MGNSVRGLRGCGEWEENSHNHKQSSDATIYYNIYKVYTFESSGATNINVYSYSYSLRDKVATEDIC